MKRSISWAILSQEHTASGSKGKAKCKALFLENNCLFLSLPEQAYPNQKRAYCIQNELAEFNSVITVNTSETPESTNCSPQDVSGKEVAIRMESAWRRTMVPAN
jgi:hypothetical protein